ncbi:MAG: DMT family transporter [Rubripirellula sp.]|nr:DMT family transporter [Rubripirellula sp.]
MHLILPLLASLLFVCGLIVIKRANAAGVSPITTLFCTNVAAAFAFSFIWLLGGDAIRWDLCWQPAIIATLFVFGLAFTFLAIERGDVSLATPIFGVKVVLVAILLTLTGEQDLPLQVWYAAALATFGIGLIQWTGNGHPHHILLTVCFALAAASCFATFDVLVQRWTPIWGAGRFLPVVYWMVGLGSLVMIPWVDFAPCKQPGVRGLLCSGSLLIGLQAICIVVAVGVFGDAVRVNVVYALRGLWGVGLAWLAAKIWGGAEIEHDRTTMLLRTAGAALLTFAVMLAILAGE